MESCHRDSSRGNQEPVAAKRKRDEGRKKRTGVEIIGKADMDHPGRSSVGWDSEVEWQRGLSRAQARRAQRQPPGPPVLPPTHTHTHIKDAAGLWLKAGLGGWRPCSFLNFLYLPFQGGFNERLAAREGLPKGWNNVHSECSAQGGQYGRGRQS